jgi:hypothetical protein
MLSAPPFLRVMFSSRRCFGLQTCTDSVVFMNDLRRGLQETYAYEGRVEIDGKPFER